MSSQTATWRRARTASTVATRRETPDLMGLFAQAQAKLTADNLVPLVQAIEAFLSDNDRKLTVAARLRELRERSPYTQEGVADHIDVSLRGYQKMEQTGGVSYPNLVKLAKLFEVDVSYFYRDEDEPAGVDQLDRIEQTLRDLQQQITGLQNAVVTLTAESLRQTQARTKPAETDRPKRRPADGS